jgi:thiol-disulfide isomerase/thioredoxin
MNVALALAFLLLFQTAPATPSSDGLEVLRTVAQRYSDAKSYHLEATVERNHHNELSRSWQKTLLKAIVAPGNKYRYEGRSGHGAAMRVSNGTTRWDYRVYVRKYTQRPVPASASEKGRVIAQEEMSVFEATNLITQLRSLASRLKSATRLPDESILLNGQKIDCHVLRYTDADFKTRRPEYTTEQTVWIDKSRNVVVKTAGRSDTYLLVNGSDAKVPLDTDDTTVFDVVHLDEPEPDSSFVFSPPPEAKLVASFPDPFAQREDLRAADFVGKPAPDIRFKNNGKDTTLSSYRGKPVFIEFWATWCAPCVDLTPELKKLYSETASKGLVWLTFDNDEDPATAEKFLKQEQIPWPNYHDEDGTIGNAFRREGIPLGILIDAEGKVTFYKTGYEIPELRSAIAKLSPDLSNVAPKATQKESTATKSNP